MNERAWELHLENVGLRRLVKDLRGRIDILEHQVDYWRNRALNGRTPGRATRKRDKETR